MKFSIPALMLIVLVTVFGCKPALHLSKSNYTLGTDTMMYDPVSKYNFYVRNNRDSLYITLLFHDHLLQRKVLARGLTVWIDTTGKEKENFGVRYPRGRQTNQGEWPHDASKTRAVHQPVVSVENKLTAYDEIELFGFTPYRKMELMLLRDSEIKPVLAYDSLKNLTYRVAIPLPALFRTRNIRFPRTVSMGFITGERTRVPGAREGMNDRYVAGQYAGTDDGGRYTHWSEARKAASDKMAQMQQEQEELSRQSILWIPDIVLK